MDDQQSRSAATYFPGEGEMVRAVHAMDWSATPIGPVSGWPACIRAAVSICLNSDFQISVLVGRELVYVYNDATAPIFGDKHPGALGRTVADVWPEAWAALGPVLTSVMDTGRAVRMDDWQLILQRRGFSEECYFSVSYSPVCDDEGRAAGVFVATMETSRRFINERRLRTLNHLATQVALRRGDERTLELVRAALADNPFDVPLCALYLAVPGEDYAAQVFCAGLHEDCIGIDKRIPWPGAGAGGGAHPLSRLAHSFEPRTYAAADLLAPGDKCGVWPEPPRQIIAVPFMVPGYATPHGFLLVAANPRAPLDQEYRHFIDTIAGLVGTAVAGIEAIAAERRRSEAMAELDRSKSQFFANASHELRTPVTLILGPLSELLEQSDAVLAPGVRDFIELAHRNAQRLHKLVNAIMDFASIEAGQLPLRLEPLDLGALTAEVASLFRSAIATALPSERTSGNILRRHGRVSQAPKEEQVPPQFFVRSQPHELWQCDFKGPVEVERRKVHPFTVLDDHSRFLLALRPCLDVTMASAWAVLWETFGEFGLPEELLCDNAFGTQFPGLPTLSWFEARLIRLGIRPTHGRPYHPQTQGKVERLHGTLEQEVWPYVDRSTLVGFDRDLQRWRTEVYNVLRPHEALGGQPPLSRFRPSPRPRPIQLPEVSYAPGSVTRVVAKGGDISWRGCRILVGAGVYGERVRLEEREQESAVFYCHKQVRCLTTAQLVKGKVL